MWQRFRPLNLAWCTSGTGESQTIALTLQNRRELLSGQCKDQHPGKNEQSAERQLERENLAEEDDSKHDGKCDAQFVDGCYQGSRRQLQGPVVEKPRNVTMAAVIARMITVRISVARFEFIPSTPILPKMAVRPAKNAESSANHCQVISNGLLQYQRHRIVSNATCATTRTKRRGQVL